MITWIFVLPFTLTLTIQVIGVQKNRNLLYSSEVDYSKMQFIKINKFWIYIKNYLAPNMSFLAKLCPAITFSLNTLVGASSCSSKMQINSHKVLHYQNTKSKSHHLTIIPFKNMYIYPRITKKAYPAITTESQKGLS